MKKKMTFFKEEPSTVAKCREYWLKKGFDLVNITSLCEVKLGNSGSCNNFSEPDESIHHIQIWYRKEIIAVMNCLREYVIDDERFLFFKDNGIEGDFIIFRKVRI
jgi:hypothetical protein